MDAERAHHEFDPLVEFAGAWTTELAERYLPIPGAPPSKYECVDGHLFMSPREDSGNSWAAGVLYRLFFDPAMKAGYFAYLPLNMKFDSNNWIEPDLVILRESLKKVKFVPVELMVMPVEFVSPSSRRNDYIDKPARCAAVGVPYFMQVEIDYDDAVVNLLGLEGGRYVPMGEAHAGREFRTELPFPMRFDPAELLES